ncbi:hypothetical protein LRY60_05780 [Candidatus Woesebacteria bacterium]|nr:hypothetical protein [Candidatus Woesebacteria bacterium]
MLYITTLADPFDLFFGAILVYRNIKVLWCIADQKSGEVNAVLGALLCGYGVGEYNETKRIEY